MQVCDQDAEASVGLEIFAKCREGLYFDNFTKFRVWYEGPWAIKSMFLREVHLFESH